VTIAADVDVDGLDWNDLLNYLPNGRVVDMTDEEIDDLLLDVRQLLGVA